MQNGNSDKIQQLINAARAEERAKLAVEAILREIHDRLTALENTHAEAAAELKWLRTVVQANYSNITILIQLMSAIWKDDRESLSSIQQRIAERAFAEPQARDGISVEAQGDVTVSADSVGRDKKRDDKKEEEKEK